jgi:hypothetical protein
MWAAGGGGADRLGAKRNALAAAAAGDVIVHFDDDDAYRRCYVRRMVGALVLGEHDLVKLASFACYDVDRRELASFDDAADRAAAAGAAGAAASWPEWHSRTWGYGFTYAYARRLALAAPYDDAWHVGEDYSFLLRAAAAGASIAAFRDDVGDPAVLHALHGGSTARTPARPTGGDAAPYEADELLPLLRRAVPRKLARAAAAAARARAASRGRPLSAGPGVVV